MELRFKKFDEFVTRDEIVLGEAHRVYHRTGEVDPELMLYASYVHVVSLATGDDYYVPTDFIVGRDPATGVIRLSVTMKQVEALTWTRIPDFVAHGQAREEALPRM